MKLFAVLWLAINLAVAPLQLLAEQAIPASDDAAPCMMHSAGGPDTSQSGHASHHSPAKDACAHCEQNGCADGGCPANSCPGMHLHPGLVSDKISATVPQRGKAPVDKVTELVTRTSPPLLKPPL